MNFIFIFYDAIGCWVGDLRCHSPSEFFEWRLIVLQAHAMHEIKHPDELQVQQCKEVVDCELTRVSTSFALNSFK